MDALKLILMVVYAIVLVWMIHAPVDLGIQSLHLHQEGKSGRAMMAIAAGWVIVGAIFLMGYSAGAERIFG